MRRLLAPGGALIADSFDLRVGASETRLAQLHRKREEGRYFGEMELRFEYKDLRGEPFTVLQVDFDALSRIAEMRGWRCERVAQAGGHYLARLQPA
ncbi:MAG TPA: hypothetical protein VNB23_06340 [Ramlibacter sp.]|nr:hypothetical protein [Ramlibacter sp.]